MSFLTASVAVAVKAVTTGLFFSAGLSTSVYGSNNSVQPSSNVVQYLIKY